MPVAAVLLYFATLGRGQAGAVEPPASTPAEVAAAVPPPAPETRTAAPESTPAGSTGTAAAVPAPTAVPATVHLAPAVTTAAADLLTVEVSAKRPCWVSATVDGRKAIERLLQAGEQQTVTVRREMVLTAGDASAIALQFNGAAARALGKSGEVVTARFNLTNYKDYLQAR